MQKFENAVLCVCIVGTHSPLDKIIAIENPNYLVKLSARLNGGLCMRKSTNYIVVKMTHAKLFLIRMYFRTILCGRNSVDRLFVTLAGFGVFRIIFNGQNNWCRECM